MIKGFALFKRLILVKIMRWVISKNFKDFKFGYDDAEWKTNTNKLCVYDDWNGFKLYYDPMDTFKRFNIISKYEFDHIPGVYEIFLPNGKKYDGFSVDLMRMLVEHLTHSGADKSKKRSEYGNGVKLFLNDAHELGYGILHIHCICKNAKEAEDKEGELIEKDKNFICIKETGHPYSYYSGTDVANAITTEKLYNVND